MDTTFEMAGEAVVVMLKKVSGMIQNLEPPEDYEPTIWKKQHSGKITMLAPGCYNIEPWVQWFPAQGLYVDYRADERLIEALKKEFGNQLTIA